jgi:hypothetical protein
VAVGCTGVGVNGEIEGVIERSVPRSDLQIGFPKHRL